MITVNILFVVAVPIEAFDGANIANKQNELRIEFVAS